MGKPTYACFGSSHFVAIAAGMCWGERPWTFERRRRRGRENTQFCIKMKGNKCIILGIYDGSLLSTDFVHTWDSQQCCSQLFLS